MMELIKEMLPIIGNVIASGVGASILLALVARMIPNDKLFTFGYGLGKSLSRAAVLRFGPAWEAVEDFILNSIGTILSGFKSGLNSDDPSAPPADSESDSKEA